MGGTDAPIRGVGGGSGGCAEGAGGVIFKFVALFVVGGDDGLEFVEVDFHGGDASPSELDGWSVGIHREIVSVIAETGR